MGGLRHRQGIFQNVERSTLKRVEPEGAVTLAVQREPGLEEAVLLLEVADLEELVEIGLGHAEVLLQ